MADWLVITLGCGFGLLCGLVLWIVEDHADGRR